MNKFTTKEIINNFDEFKGKSLRFYTWPKGKNGILIGVSPHQDSFVLEFEEKLQMEYGYFVGYWEIAYSPTTNFILED